MKLLIIIASTLSLLVVTQVSTILAGGHGQPTFMWTRTVHVAAGQGPKASEQAMKIKKYVEETVGIDVKIRFPVSGQTNRIIFSTSFKSMDQQMMTNFKLEASKGWGPLLMEGSDVFISAYDDWWIVQ